jgi:hypothetical protein
MSGAGRLAPAEVAVDRARCSIRVVAQPILEREKLFDVPELPEGRVLEPNGDGAALVLFRGLSQ